MKGGRLPLGYTIVEVMIVLAISGLMFLIAATFINGKQQKTAFTQGVNGLAANFQSTIEAVTDGQYSDAPFICTLVSSQPLIITSGSGSQGAHAGCVFLGKFIHFGVDSSNLSKYEVFSLADASNDPSTGNPITNFNNDYVTPIYQNVDLTSQESMAQGIQFTGEKVTNTTGSTNSGYYGFGFVQGQGATDTNGAYQSGYQTIQMVYAPGLTTAQIESSAGSTLTGATALSAAQTVNVCVSDGGSQNATLVIGSNGGQLSVDVQMGVSNC